MGLGAHYSLPQLLNDAIVFSVLHSVDVMMYLSWVTINKMLLAYTYSHTVHEILNNSSCLLLVTSSHIV